MIGAVKTTPTMALQLWMTETVQDLGWPYDRTILTAFQDPLDTWGDVTPFLALETWPEPPPRSLGFFCGSFRDDPPAPPPSPVPQFPRAEAAYARQLALDWVKQHLASLWPNVEYSGAIQWQKFYDPYGATGEARFAAQYVRANINPSDRYVLSVPGSVFARMAADGSGVGNLFLAGDWVRTGLNAGCMEAAVMAGRAAAGAIKGVHIAMPNSSDFDDFALPAVILPTVEVLRQLGRAAAAGVGNTSAYCVIVPMERDFVRSKLPPGLKLRHPSAATQKHDVVLIFARQTNVRPGFVPLGGINYNEVSMLIPYVTYGPNSGSDLEFSYMPHLLLDDLAAVLVGQNLYGFNKQLARIRAVDGAFDVPQPNWRSSGAVRADWSARRYLAFQGHRENARRHGVAARRCRGQRFLHPFDRRSPPRCRDFPGCQGQGHHWPSLRERGDGDRGASGHSAGRLQGSPTVCERPRLPYGNPLQLQSAISRLCARGDDGRLWPAPACGGTPSRSYGWVAAPASLERDRGSSPHRALSALGFSPCARA